MIDKLFQLLEDGMILFVMAVGGMTLAGITLHVISLLCDC